MASSILTIWRESAIVYKPNRIAGYQIDCPTHVRFTAPSFTTPIRSTKAQDARNTRIKGPQTPATDLHMTHSVHLGAGEARFPKLSPC